MHSAKWIPQTSSCPPCIYEEEEKKKKKKEKNKKTKMTQKEEEKRCFCVLQGIDHMFFGDNSA
jgi:hypothetical protein